MADISRFSEQAQQLAREANALAQKAIAIQQQAEASQMVDPFVFMLTVFVLACFVGYYVVWKVTPALHTPLMSVTNAISGIIIVGAIIAVGPAEGGLSTIIGFLAVAIAAVNIFGGFMVTHRMLSMYKKRPKAEK
jgi:NAD(P) transhydrogenase subunit alpha